MNSWKIVPNQPQTIEEQKKRLKEIVEATEKSGSKFFDPVAKGQNIKINSQANSLEKTDIVIPDIFTAFGYAGIAAAIINKSGGPINYWYTYNGTQKWYYKYTIEKGGLTWNWQWSDSYTHHCMIIEIPINDGSGDSWFFVPAVISYENPDLISAYFPILNVYYTRAKADNPPKFSEKVWIILYKNCFPDSRTLDAALNFHIKIKCYDDTIDWDF